MKWFRDYLCEALNTKELKEHEMSVFNYNTDILGGAAIAIAVVLRARNRKFGVSIVVS